MSKPQTGTKQQKQKTPKEMIKALEEQLFGEKNKSRKKEIQNMIKKIEFDLELERKKKQEIEEEKRNAVVQQVIPVGVDPKTVQCINFLNKNCSKGEQCPFGHFVEREEKKEAVQTRAKARGICKFLVDAMNSGEYSKAWTCPLPRCQDVHRLVELADNQEVEVSLEEYIELQRQTIDEEALTPVNEKTFAEWRAKKEREEELHARRVAALSVNGKDLFQKNPEMFEDDEEAGEEIDYGERNYEESEEKDGETLAEC